MPDLEPPLTISDWHRVFLSGVAVRDALERHASRVLAAPPDAAWIARNDLPAVRRRIEELEALAEACPDRRELLRRWPLFGVPFAVKDNIDVAGEPTTAACPAFAHVATGNATVVQKLLDAGALLIGKTNLDQFATGLVGTRSPYGAPASAFAADRISGGSSSGSAVAVARAEVTFALGTDTAGSGRIPAGFNNIVGLKPTPGRVGTSGVLPACRSLDCVSVLALCVDDAAAVLAVIEGHDDRDDYSRFVAGPAQWPERLRVGVPREPRVDDDAGYARAWQDACSNLEALGVSVVPIDFAPLHALAGLLYDGPWLAERYAVVETLLDTAPDSLDPTVAGIIAGARTMTAVDAFRAWYALQHARKATARIWQEVDLLMVPTAPRHPRFDEVSADPVRANAALGIYTNFVNLLGWCALALPGGITAAGLPFGVTFIADAHTDAALSRWGQRWERATAPELGATGRPRTASAETLTAWPRSEATCAIAVVGAHLSGLPLNSQLTERGATLRARTATAAAYRLYALPGTTPPKPGLVRVDRGGVAIDVEVWDMPQAAVGSFLALIASPLGLGTVELTDGSRVHGFLCEPFALEGATDISRHGGWRAYLASV